MAQPHRPQPQPFWDALQRGELVLPRCLQCGSWNHFSQATCSTCSSRDFQWPRCSGRGRVYSYVVEHRGAPDSPGVMPRVIAVVELEEGPRVMGHLELTKPQTSLGINIPVEIVFPGTHESGSLLTFRPLSSDARDLP